MSRDAVVNYVDTELKDILPDDLKEELLSLHYTAVANARKQGQRSGLTNTTPKDIPDKPKGPSNRVIRETPPFPIIALVMVVIGISIMAL